MSMQVGAKGVNSEMNVTPLIDVLLVLLIIFMVVTPLMMMQHRLEVPKKAEVDLPPDVTQDQVVLTFTRDKHVYLNTKEVELAQLRKSLDDIFRNRREKTIFLNIDPDANYGDSVKVVDTVRNAGLEKMAVITLKEGEKFQIPGAKSDAPEPSGG
ncbi:MAG TPA: biopolymer transporter ExbD [Myxococcota bacterium]|nr:biopolymer transporter ExbD [Myxococcota bacterium]HRY92088.1 biopolymer transporter ExbD [Myxococcota bacterium]HSA22146.1 biopolymer transporter ExbD [Myxococcota bacterium]